jgi:uncharacterized Fe-S cluster protein YjdI/SAM-dependent methyltransferase
MGGEEITERTSELPRDEPGEAPEGFREQPGYAPGVERAYANDRIEVMWEPAFCIHVAECLRGLPAVFDNQRRPWIIVDNGSPGDVGAVIQRCPTGALRFRCLDGRPQEPAPEATTIQERPNGVRVLPGNGVWGVPRRVCEGGGAVFPARGWARDTRCGIEGGNAMGDSDSDYEIGSGEDELARLELQGRALAPATRMIFAAAGIRPGMRVLDLGCGAGDVAFVAADLVGSDGHVVGVDRSPEALARARLRAEQRGLAQVRFVEGDLDDAAPGGPFDAIVGRLVLMYVPDPAAVLRRQATVLRAGGLVVPVEVDIPAARSLPATPLVSQAIAWIVEALAKAGIPPSLGTRLWAIFREAGLHPQGMIGIQPHFGPDDPAAVALLTGVIRTVAPLIERTGVATNQEIGVETFAQRLRDELQENSAVFAHPLLLSVWATTSLL